MPEFRNTPPPTPISERDTEVLLENLTSALCEVGGYGGRQSPDERAIASIETVRELHAELNNRKVTLTDYLNQLTATTGWMMSQLLDECMQWPEQTPQVREMDGIRRMFRCPLCSKEEVPDYNGIFFGTECLQRAAGAIQQRTPFDGIVIYRTYNTDARCRHANDETVLAVPDELYDVSFRDSFCLECISEELARRTAMSL
jgi:hypothetical protein